MLSVGIGLMTPDHRSTSARRTRGYATIDTAFLSAPQYPLCAMAFSDPNVIGFDQGIGGFEELAHDYDDGDFGRFYGFAKLGEDGGAKVGHGSDWPPVHEATEHVLDPAVRL